MNLYLRGGDPLKYRGDVLVLGHFSDTKPLAGTVAYLDWMFNASLSNLWKAKPGLLDFGVQTLLPTLGKLPFPYLVLMGLGRKGDLSGDLRKEIYRMGLNAALGMKARKLGCEVIPVSGKMDMSAIDDFALVAGKFGEGSLENASLFVPSPELLTEAKKVYTQMEVDEEEVEPPTAELAP